MESNSPKQGNRADSVFERRDKRFSLHDIYNQQEVLSHIEQYPTHMCENRLHDHFAF